MKTTRHDPQCGHTKTSGRPKRGWVAYRSGGITRWFCCPAHAAYFALDECGGSVSDLLAGWYAA